MRSLKYLLATTLICSLSGCAEWWIDTEMEKLCKAEGGIKVFETVKLPADQFRADGYPVFFKEMDSRIKFEDWLGAEYVLESNAKTLKTTLGVTLNSSSTTVIRRSDKKILGISTRFSRYPNRIPLGEGAGKVCPDPSNEPKPTKDVIQSIFVSQ